MSTLFALPSDDVKPTADDCYTPRWVFDAMALRFDLDVASPPGGPLHVPAARYFTAADDGLAQPWLGVVWCNPPYSDTCEFIRPGNTSIRPMHGLFVAFRGVGVEPAERLAAADRFGAVLYGRP